MSLNLSVPVPESVTIDEAKKRMEDLLSKLAAQNRGMISELTESWDGYKNDFSFKANGQLISGNLVVGHNNVVMTAQLPFLVSFFKGQIEKTIKAEASAALNA